MTSSTLEMEAAFAVSGRLAWKRPSAGRRLCCRHGAASPVDRRKPWPSGLACLAQAETSGEGSTVDVHAEEQTLEELKEELVLATAGINRGISCSPARRAELLELVEALEKRYTGKAPNDEIDMLCGTWRLVFTTALDVLSLGVVPLFQVGEVYQNIELPSSGDKGDVTLYNIVDVEPYLSPVTNAFGGDCRSSLKVTAEGQFEGGQRVNITFVRSALTPERFLGFDVPATIPKLEVPLRSPVGWVDTTFLDKDVRVARAPGDGVFVLWRTG